MRFKDALAGPGLGAIAEIKRRSPSLGDIRPDADPAQLAAAYARAGAAAVSVLVDELFGGDWDDLRAARAATGVPLLAKGFFSTEEHLRTAKEAGADAVLLLLRDLDDAQVRLLLGLAGELGLDTLVEAHDADELERAVGHGAPVIGVNARDLSTFEIDRETQLALVARIPPDRVAIAESGVRTRAQGAAAELAGADAILVGSALMQAPDPAAKLRELLARPLVKVCGLTREEDVAVAAEAGADLAGFILVPESPRAATDVLPVPDELLAVAVWVGEAGPSGAPLDQVHERSEGARPRPRRGAPARRRGGCAAARSPLAAGGSRPLGPRGVCAGPGRARRQARGRQRRRRDPARSPLGGRRELAPGDGAGDQGSREGAGLRGGGAWLAPMAPTAAGTSRRR